MVVDMIGQRGKD